MFTSMVGTSSQNHNYTVQCMVLLVRMYICMWIAVMGLSLTWVTYSTTCEMGGGEGRGVVGTRTHINAVFFLPQDYYT